MATDRVRTLRVRCWDANGTVLAESRSKSASAARQRAHWLLDNVPDAQGAGVPQTQYEVAR